MAADDPQKLGDVLPILSAFDGWTDEQWAAHDARIEAAKQAEREASIAPLFREPPWRDRGWEARSIAAAERADVDKPAIRRVRQWDPADRSVLLLSGAAGCGKTVAAAWWALNTPKYRRHARFIRASTFAAASRYDQTHRSFCYEAHALVLDDLGMEFMDSKGSFQVDLDELVDTFYADERPLIITTNMRWTDFAGRYGTRVSDRLTQCARVFELGGPSLRGAP